MTKRRVTGRPEAHVPGYRKPSYLSKRKENMKTYRLPENRRGITKS